MHLVLAFTVIEVLIVVVLIGLLATWVVSLFSGSKKEVEKTEKVTYSSGWLNAATTILPAPDTGKLTYQVMQQKGTAVAQPAEDRTVMFNLTGPGTMVSVTQSGSPLQLPTGTKASPGLTDTYGLITV